MPLRELQIDFLAALAGGAAASAATRHLAGHDAAARLEVYRNTRARNFEDALRSSYPVIARLVGADYFRQTAGAFQRRRPSRSGDLLHVGQHFSDYLAGLHAGDGYDYLADVARLEWLIQDAMLAADHPPLDLDELRQVPPAAYDALRFVPHPSLRLFESRFPARRIWEANVQTETEPPLIGLDAGGDRLAILSCRLELAFLPLSVAETTLLEAILRDAPFATALEAAVSREERFDAGAALWRFAAAGALAGFSA